MTDLVDQMFPPIHRKWAPEFTDVNFWRPPMVDFEFPELTAPAPPSPALSARSDASMQTGLSRLRNFSLRGPSPQFVPPSTQHTRQNGQQARMDHQRAKSSMGNASALINGAAQGHHMRHVSSGGALRNSNVAVPRMNGGAGSFEERRAAHRMSGGSMPGSYEEFRPDDGEEEEEEEEDDGESDEEGEEEEDGEYSDEEEEGEEHMELEHEEFDDELLATGAMDDIPFL